MRRRSRGVGVGGEGRRRRGWRNGRMGRRGKLSIQICFAKVIKFIRRTFLSGERFS